MARRTIKHWTPHYIYSRISLQIDLLRHPLDPWLTRTAINLLDGLLRPNDIGFEWGSGRSTSWFASHTKHLTSIEHDSEWHTRVQGTLSRMNLTNVDYQYHNVSTYDESVESSYESSYVQSVSNVPDDSVDYILVDGWGRDWCALACMSKLKSDGLLIIDNANWYLTTPAWVKAPNSQTLQQGPRTQSWATFLESSQSWRRIWTSNGVTATLIMFKAK